MSLESILATWRSEVTAISKDGDLSYDRKLVETRKVTRKAVKVLNEEEGMSAAEILEWIPLDEERVNRMIAKGEL